MHSLSWIHEHVLLFGKEMHPVLMPFPLDGRLRKKLPCGPWHTEKDTWACPTFLGTHREVEIKPYAFGVINES